MLYMVIERFKNGDPGPVYARFEKEGRLLPDGLTYLNSWVSADRTHCYQLMETGDPKLLDVWMDRWRDVTDFEVVDLAPND
jgi:hypothetical protein